MPIGLFTTISLRQYGQSPQLLTQGYKQAEWNLWSHGRHISSSPSVKLSRHIPQSNDTFDTSSSSPILKLLKISLCKQSRASWVRPGGFSFSASCTNCTLPVSVIKSVKGDTTAVNCLVELSAPQSPASSNLNSPSNKFLLRLPDEALELLLHKAKQSRSLPSHSVKLRDYGAEIVV